MMSPITRLKLIALSIVLSFFTGIGILIALSLVPYMHWIGIASLVLVGTIVLCGVRIMLAFTSSTVQQLHYKGNTVTSGDVVVYHSDNNIVHLSALHEQSKLQMKQITQPAIVTEPNDTTIADADVINLYETGHTLRTIAEATGLTYYAVQKIVAGSK